mmetsp:Transcript_11507/g.12643  ORF Transcript_11507/g.12643 Transcript_11507/m.12643 type:complete len:171 (+) Transcript_11507:20-532(+)
MESQALTEGVAFMGGGCFWCIEPVFAELPGVSKVISGIMSVAEGSPIEVVKISYNPSQISYRQLVKLLLKNIDPTQKNGQFTNLGTEYQTAVFYSTEEELKMGREELDSLVASGKFSKPIETLLLPANEFSAAGEEHQSYYKKHPEEFKKYEKEIGRTAFLSSCPLRNDD